MVVHCFSGGCSRGGARWLQPPHSKEEGAYVARNKAQIFSTTAIDIHHCTKLLMRVHYTPGLCLRHHTCTCSTMVTCSVRWSWGTSNWWWSIDHCVLPTVWYLLHACSPVIGTLSRTTLTTCIETRWLTVALNIQISQQLPLITNTPMKQELILQYMQLVIVITWTRGRWLIYCTRAQSARGL